MSARLKWIGISLFVLLAAIVGTWLAWPALRLKMAAVHQRSITRELANWEQEFAKPRTEEEASAAVDRLSYIRRYYVPGPGYRSDEQTEAALEAQRAKTIKTMTQALEEYTGEHFGQDVDQWEKWRDGRKRKAPVGGAKDGTPL